MIRAARPTTNASSAVRRSLPSTIGIGPINTTPPMDGRSGGPVDPLGTGMKNDRKMTTTAAKAKSNDAAPKAPSAFSTGNIKNR